MEHNKILGVVLAGGKSSRFGADKSEAILGNKKLINLFPTPELDETKKRVQITAAMS